MNSKKYLLQSISMTYHLNLTKQGFHQFVLTTLPQSLFNTLMDLLYSAFFSKLFISNDSFTLRSFMLDNFASVFGWSQLNRPWQSLECSVAPNAPYFPAMLSSWCSTDRVSPRFFCFSNVSPPLQSQLNLFNWGNCLVIVYFSYCIV